MAGRCGCSNQCSCLVVSGTGVVVSGAGSIVDPYVITLGGGVVTVADTASMDLVLSGQGTTADPYLLTANILNQYTPVLTKTTSYNLAITDRTVIFNATTLTASLPDPTLVLVGRAYTIKNIFAGNLTVNSQGVTKTLDGAASQTLAQWAKATYISNGTQWLTV